MKQRASVFCGFLKGRISNIDKPLVRVTKKEEKKKFPKSRRNRTSY